jgi:hypothetical protein
MKFKLFLKKNELEIRRKKDVKESVKTC